MYLVNLEGSIIFNWAILVATNSIRGKAVKIEMYLVNIEGSTIFNWVILVATNSIRGKAVKLKCTC
jgi:hypothetical protein